MTRQGGPRYSGRRTETVLHQCNAECPRGRESRCILFTGTMFHLDNCNGRRRDSGEYHLATFLKELSRIKEKMAAAFLGNTADAGLGENAATREGAWIMLLPATPADTRAPELQTGMEQGKERDCRTVQGTLWRKCGSPRYLQNALFTTGA